MKGIEETIFDMGLPVNTRVMAARLIEILEEEGKATADGRMRLFSEDGKRKFRKCLWLINSQVFGQMATIDLSEEWDSLLKLESS